MRLTAKRVCCVDHMTSSIQISWHYLRQQTVATRTLQSAPIHKQRLKELFLCWSLLSSQERDELDRQVLSNFTQERMSLYKPLKEALYRWELLQDTQGAPGCEPGTVSFSCDPQLEEEITNIIYTLEVLLKKLRACGSKSKNVAIINIEMCKDVGALTSNDRKSRQPGKSLSKSRAVPAHSVQSYSQLLMANNEFSVELSGYNTD
ncbi:unnamed protein product [Timema podura]|uniref:Uncharacterized protein n=1 Tax=Timema podura TaxID=61482 RepID=A0ABN7NPJ0_TIMPD|nr:unnamed protein product [Timema podura]